MGAQTTASTSITAKRTSKKPTRPYKPKVKTGCMSCRTRRVKCDEGKPSCKRCTQTGRTCDGYEDLFRPLQWAPVNDRSSSMSKTPRENSLSTAKPRSPQMAVMQMHTPPLTPPAPASAPAPSLAVPMRILTSHYSTPGPPLMAAPLPHSRPIVTKEDVAALALRFSNKHVAGGYEDEARVTLEASLSEPAVRHAMGALTSVYETLENHGHALPRGKPVIPAVYDGLQEYNNAIANLASKLSSVDPRSVEIALVCCRLFISIEVMLKSYLAVTRHYFRGLKIMHETGARAHIDALNNVVPTQHPHFPKIDIFMLKIFTAPDDISPSFRKAARAIKRGTKLSPKQFVEIARLARTEVRAGRAKGRLLAVSELSIRFLDKVAKLQPGADVDKMLAEKHALLQLLEHMRDDFQDADDGRKEFGPYHGRFLSMFHVALWIPVYMSLWPPTRDIGELLPLFDRISGIAWNASRGFGKLLDG